GTYFSIPSTPVLVTDETTPAATGAKFNLTFVAEDRLNKSLVSVGKTVTISSPGVGYIVGDVITVLGGDFGVQAQLTVPSASPTGGITGLEFLNKGTYLATTGNPFDVDDPFNPAGTGAKVTLTFDTIAASMVDNLLATTFLIKMKPGKELKGVGTYSYAVGSL